MSKRRQPAPSTNAPASNQYELAASKTYTPLGLLGTMAGGNSCVKDIDFGGFNMDDGFIFDVMMGKCPAPESKSEWIPHLPESWLGG